MLNTLRKQAADLESQIRKASQAGDKVRMQRLQRDLNDVNRTIRQMTTESASAAEVMRRLDRATPNELNRTLRTMRRELNKLPRDSQAYIDKLEQIRKVKKEISTVNAQLRPELSFWQRLSGAVTGNVAGFLSLVGAIDLARRALIGCIDSYVQLDAAMAGVSKYTGLSREEVELLNKDLKKLDTRTDLLQLNELAGEAGRLGKSSREEILGYVKAADIIRVALDELGDDATQTISKLAGVFGLEAELGTEQALLRVGSVVNELSAKCSASAPYLVEFGSRIGSVGKQAGMSMDSLLAYGALFDSMNVNVELASTALSKLITHLFQDPAKYARIAGIEVEKFSTLLRTDTNEAIILLVETLSKKGGLDKLAPMFKEMGENGVGAQMALNTLANNVDTLRIRQEEASAAFADGTSVITEFNVQNSTLEARLEKNRKKFRDIARDLGKSLLPMINILIKGGAGVASVLEMALREITANGKELVVLTAALAAYNLALNATAIKEGVVNALMATRNGLMKVGTAIQTTLTAAYHLGAAGLLSLSGSTAAATVHMQAFNAACASNPIGAVVTAILAAVAALQLYNLTAEEAVSKEKALADATANAASEREKARQGIDDMISRLEAANLTKAEEARLVAECNDQYGPILGRYKSVSEWLKVLKTRGDEYTDSVYQMTLAEGKLEAARQLIAEAARKRADGDAYTPGFLTTFNNTMTYEKWYDPSTWRLHGWSEARQIVKDRYRNEAESEAAAMEKIAEELARDGAKQKAALEKKRRATVVAPEAAPEAAPEVPASVPETPSSDSGGGGKSRAREREAARQREEKETARKFLELIEKRRKRIEETSDRQIALENAAFSQSDKNLNDRINHENKLFEIKQKRYWSMMALYMKGTKEYVELANGLATEEFNHEMALSGILTETVKGMQKEYLGSTSATERFKIEKAALDALRDNKGVDDDLYDRILEGMKKKISSDLPGTEKKESGESKYKKQLAELKDALDAGLILEEEYRRRVESLKKDSASGITSALNGNGSEWVAAFSEAYDAWGAFADAIKNNGDVYETFSNAITSSMALVKAGMEATTQLVSMETEKQINSINKRYDRQKVLAEGNAWMERRLEEEKTAEIARMKSKAAQKEFNMQVLMTVAQTAANAVAAYGSALKIGPAGLVLAPIAAALAAAQGAVQVAVLKKQADLAASTGYMTGGFTPDGPEDEPVGVVHAGEWVAPRRLLRDPRTRPMINMLEAARRTNRIATLSPEDVSASITAPMRIAGSASPEASSGGRDDSGLVLLAEAAGKMSSAAKALRGRLDEPFVTVNTVTGPHGIRKALDEYDRMMRNTEKSKR